MTATVLKTKISKVERKIPDTSDLVTTTVLNIKIRKIENKIPDTSGLVKKHIITLKYRTLRQNIFLHLIIIILRKKCFMQKIKRNRISW